MLDLTKKKIFNNSAFTIIGNPTITPNGIASGFSSTNGITFPFSSNTKDFELDLNFEFLDKKNDYSGYVIHGSFSPIMIWINKDRINCNIAFILCNYGASKQFNITKAFGFPLNTRFYTKHIFKNNLYSVKFMMEGNNEWIDCGFKSVDEDITFINTVNYGIYSSSVSIDLKDIRHINNGIEVISGSKIILPPVKRNIIDLT